MEISRLGKQKVRCLISEQEIEDMGYSLDEIMKNGEATSSFMDKIFAMAERQLGITFGDGVKTVRADFLPNHTISLTFTIMSAENMMDHLKNLVSDIFDSMGEEKAQEPDPEELDGEFPEIFSDMEENPKKQGMESGSGDLPAGAGRKVTLEFENFDTLLRFAGKTENQPDVISSLYKFEQRYYLLLDLECTPDDRAEKLLYAAEEFADDLFINRGAPAMIREHGEMLIGEGAMENLKEII